MISSMIMNILDTNFKWIVEMCLGSFNNLQFYSFQMWYQVLFDFLPKILFQSLTKVHLLFG